MRSGILIVIDGPDATGKGTQVSLLIEALKKLNHDVVKADFPQYGKKSAGLVENYLNGRYGTPEEVGPYRASVLYAVDRYDASFEIKKILGEGKIIVSNRYVSANMGHQAGKIKDLILRDKFLEWLDYFEFNLFDIPRPDLNILLVSNPEISQRLVDTKEARDYLEGKSRDIHEDDKNHLMDAQEAFIYVAQKYNWVIVNCLDKNWQMRTREDIAEQILKEVLNKFPKI